VQNIKLESTPGKEFVKMIRIAKSDWDSNEEKKP
jgi:hypothetical protein